MLSRNGLKWCEKFVHKGSLRSLGIRPAPSPSKAVRVSLYHTNPGRCGARPCLRQRVHNSSTTQNRRAISWSSFVPWESTSSTPVETQPNLAPTDTLPAAASPESLGPTNGFTSENVESSASALSDASQPAVDIFGDTITAIPERFPAQIGDLKSLGLDFGWGTTSMVEWCVEHAHVFSGLPWWGSIMITAVIIRVAMFRPLMALSDTTARMNTIKSLVKPLSEKMKQARVDGNTQIATEVRDEMSRIYKQAGIKPLNSALILLQVAFGFGTFRLLRNMASLPVPTLETGGIAWFSDLTVADPFYILPIATAGMLYFTLKRGGESGVNSMSPTALRFARVGIPTLSFAFSSFWPAALQYSFLLSTIWGYFQARVLSNASFRAYTGLTPIPKPEETSTSSATSGSSGKLNVAPTYQPPNKTSLASISAESAADSKGSKSTGFISGAKKELRGMIDEARRTVTNYTGASSKPGKKSAQEKRKAQNYEVRRQREEEEKELFRRREYRRRRQKRKSESSED